MSSPFSFTFFPNLYQDGSWPTDDLLTIQSTSSANLPPLPQQPSGFFDTWDPSIDPWDLSDFLDSAYESSPNRDGPSAGQHLSVLAQQRPLPAFSTQELLAGFGSGLIEFVPDHLPAAPLTSDPAQNFVQPQQQQSQEQQPPVWTASAQPLSQAANHSRPVLFCGQCNYNTANGEEFRRHTESVHNNIRRHHCDICDIYLNDPSGLSKHKKSAKHRRRAQELGRTAASPNHCYECPTCRANGKTDARYARADHLKRHLKYSCGQANGTLPAGFFDGPGGMNLGKVRV